MVMANLSRLQNQHSFHLIKHLKALQLFWGSASIVSKQGRLDLSVTQKIPEPLIWICSFGLFLLFAAGQRKQQ